MRAAAASGSLAAEAFLPRGSSSGGERSLARLLALVWEGGLQGVLATVSSSPWAGRLLSLLSWAPSSSLYPHLKLSPQELLQVRPELRHQ